MLFAYFLYIAHLKKSRVEALCLWKNLCSWKYQKQEKFLSKKKKRKEAEKQALRRKKEYHSVKKRKKASVKATRTNEAPRWLPHFEHRSSVKTKFAIHKVQIEVSYYSCE